MTAAAEHHPAPAWYRAGTTLALPLSAESFCYRPRHASPWKPVPDPRPEPAWSLLHRHPSTSGGEQEQVPTIVWSLTLVVEPGRVLLTCPQAPPLAWRRGHGVDEVASLFWFGGLSDHPREHDGQPQLWLLESDGTTLATLIGPACGKTAAHEFAVASNLGWTTGFFEGMARPHERHVQLLAGPMIELSSSQRWRAYWWGWARVAAMLGFMWFLLEVLPARPPR